MKVFLIIFILSASIGYSQVDQNLYDSAKKSFEHDKYQIALIQINSALTIDSLSSKFLDLKGRILHNLKKFHDSYDIFSKAIFFDPKNSELYKDRAHLLQTIQQFDPSISDYTKAIDLATVDSIRNSYLIGRSNSKSAKRDFYGAYDDLMEVYRNDSNNIAALTNLATVCDDVGKNEKSLLYSLKVLKLKPDFYPALGNIGFEYQLLGDHKNAILYFNKVLEINPNEPLGYSNRAYSKLKIGDLAGAKIDIDKSIKLYPSNSYAYRIRALISIENSNFEEACIDLRKALELGFTTMYGDEVSKLIQQHCK